MDSSPVVNAMGPVVTDRVSAALETGMVSATVDPIQRVLAATHGADRSIACWDKLSRPKVGLMDAEQVMHGGAPDGPALSN